MTVFEAVNTTENSGAMKILLANGLLSPKATFYREIYLFVDKEIKLGSKKYVAYQHVAETMGVHIDTVRNAVRLMKS